MKGVKYQQVLDEIRVICSPQIVLEVEPPKYQKFYTFVNSETKVCYGMITPSVLRIDQDYCNLDDMDTLEILRWLKEKMKGVMNS